MDIKDLICIETVYKNGSIAKAAELLFITPQAVSKRINKIEHELNIVIFERTSSGTTLTKTGELFVEKSSEIISNFNQLNETFNNNQIISDAYLASAQDVFSYLISKIDLNPIKIYNDYKIRIKETGEYDVDKMVSENIVDLGYAISPITDPQLNVVPLLKIPFFAILNQNHPLANKLSISLNDLNDNPIIIKSREFKINNAFYKICNELNFNSNIYLETPDTKLMYKLASEESCISISIKLDALLSEWNNLVAIPIEEALSWEICLVYKNNNHFKKNIKELIKKITTEIPKI